MKVDFFLGDKRAFRDGTIQDPPITVIMPTYQRSRGGMLERALTAVLNQTFRDFEFIVIDDGSRDGTEEILRQSVKKDPRLHLIRHEKNSGLPAIRANEGVLEARGRYIAFAFDDDLWYENMLEHLYGLIKQDDSLDAVYGVNKYYKQEGENFELFTDSYGGRVFSARDIKVSNFIPCNAFLIKKEAMIRVGLFNPHILTRRIADWDFWVRAAKIVKIGETPLLCGEMNEMQEGDLPRLGNVDVDLLSRFANLLNLQQPLIRSYRDLADYEIDGLPSKLNRAFSRLDILTFSKMIRDYFKQAQIPRPDPMEALISRGQERRIKAGLFETGPGFHPELIGQLAHYGSVRYLSPEVPLFEIQKSNLILFDTFSPDLLDLPYYKSLRFWINCICLGSGDSFPERFGDIHIIDPRADDMAKVAEKIAGWFYKKTFTSIDSAKLLALSRTFSDVTNIIDHAKKSRRKNPVVNHISEILGNKP